MSKEETNVPEEQVEQTETPSNVVESATPKEDVSYEDAKDAAFDSIDLDNPDMSLFAEATTVEETPEVPVEENENTEEQTEVVNDNPFALDDDGYLVNPLIDRGKEVKVTPEELFQFGMKGLNYEQKNAEVKPFREHLNLLKGNPDLPTEDLQSLIDLAGGNKDALKHLISKYDVDVMDLDTSETEYTPDVSNAKVDEVQEMWTDYQKQNPDNSEKVSSTFNSMSEEFKSEVHNLEVLPLFIKDVENGMFDTLKPETDKIKALHPNLTWLEAYGHANQRYANRQERSGPPDNVAAPEDRGTPDGGATTKAKDIWDTPGVFEEMTKKLSL